MTNEERDQAGPDGRYEAAARTALENWRSNREVAAAGGVTALTLSEAIIEQARITGLDRDAISERMRDVLSPDEMAMWEGES